jgi:hypothetical protein
MSMRFKHVDLGQHFGCLILEPNLLHLVIFLRVLTRTVFEVQIPQVVIQNFFPLAQIFEAGLLMLLLNVALRIKDVEQHPGKKKSASHYDHSSVSLRILSRIAVKVGVG